jgi:DNA mismatch endonuclease (patch repair protein)
MQVSEATRRSMSSNRGTGTKPEVAFRKALWAVGMRGYRVNVRKLPGSPDVVFGKRKLAVFVNGCFWHACPQCGRFSFPKKNAEYWRLKIEANQERDSRVAEQLTALGYRVLTVWECEIKKDINACVRLTRLALSQT